YNGVHVEVYVGYMTLPTYRRTVLILQSLYSLKTQITDRSFTIVVIENEADKREGAQVAAPLFEAGEYSGVVIVEDKPGNCNAYNAGWLTALTYFPNFKYILVIDDDELADRDWIENLVSTAERFDVSLVGGPQLPLFEKPNSDPWAKHPAFKPPYDKTGRVPIIYSSGNLLIAR